MNRMSRRRREKIEAARNKAFGKRWRRLWNQRKDATPDEKAALVRRFSDYIHRNDPMYQRMNQASQSFFNGWRSLMYERHVGNMQRRLLLQGADIFELYPISMEDPSGSPLTVQVLKEREPSAVGFTLTLDCIDRPINDKE